MATETVSKPAIMTGQTRAKVYKNFIDGEWIDSASGATFENRNPADTATWSAFFRVPARPTWMPLSTPPNARSAQN